MPKVMPKIALTGALQDGSFEVSFGTVQQPQTSAIHSQ